MSPSVLLDDDEDEDAVLSDFPGDDPGGLEVGGNGGGGCFGLIRLLISSSFLHLQTKNYFGIKFLMISGIDFFFLRRFGD